MTRIRHSFAGYLRLMQISSTNLFVFTEGKQSDPYFYANILSSIPSLGISYEIRLARTIPSNTGGKEALLTFFEYLRRKDALYSSLGSQNTTCLFMLDKDIDDLQRRKKRSPHVIYTEHYDVQNYIFLHGNLVIGGASAASVNPALLQTTLSDSDAWCRRIAVLWKDWIVLCLKIVADHIHCEANFRLTSQIQARPCGATDSLLYATLTRNIARRCSVPVTRFRNDLSKTKKKVDRYFSQDQHHRLFKGKWFATALVDEIDQIMAGQQYDTEGLSGRITSCVAATLDFNNPWADHFRIPISDVIARL